jgi:hypothetical protein
MYRYVVVTLVALLSSTSALAADMLPLSRGIYVPVGHACKGASNADMVNYWGGRSSLGASGGDCTIKKLSHVGAVYTIKDICKSLDGQVIDGGDTVISIDGPTRFTLSGTQFRYCGPKVQF